MDKTVSNAIDAAVLQRLITHLDNHKEVQNIDLMLLADFCRNCLSKWYVAAAKEQGLDMAPGEAQQRIYGMDYREWKELYQKPATPEQLLALEQKKAASS